MTKRPKVKGLDRATQDARTRFIRDLHAAAANYAMAELRDMYRADYEIFKQLHEERLLKERGPIPGDPTPNNAKGAT